MIQIRMNAFETNSSSTHTITLCSTDMYERWCNNDDVYFDSYKDELVTREQCDEKEFLRDEKIRKCLKDEPIEYVDDEERDEIEDCRYSDMRYLTVDDYEQRFEYEESYECKRNINGVDVVAFGYYGYDC